MTRFKLTKRGQILAARGKLRKGNAVFQKDVFKMYILKNTGEKVLVNESVVFPKKWGYARGAA